MKNTMYNCVMMIIITLFSMLITLNSYDLSRRLETNQILSLSKNSKNGVSALFITGRPGKSAVINFRLKNTSVLYSMGLIGNEFTIMSKEFKYLSVKEDKSVTMKGASILSNSLSISGGVNYMDKPQWRMIMYDSFNKNNTSLGWDYDKTTECNYYKMLGGNCQTSEKEMIKEVDNLPTHTMVKIEAFYHFIGTWDSHTGYLKLDNINGRKDDPKYVWTYRCKNQKSPLLNSKSLCVNQEVCKLGVPISITLSHSDKKIKLIFGSTLSGNACDKSYGVSDIRISVR